MGFIEEKKLLMEEAGILKVINDIPDTKTTSSFESSDDKSRNILPFLLDFLGIMIDNKKEERQKEKEKKEKNVERGFTFDLPGKGKMNERRESKEEKKRKKQEEKEAERENRTYWEKLLFEVLNKFYPQFILILKNAIINGTIECNSCSSEFAIPPNQKINLLLSQIDFSSVFKNDVGSTASNLLFDDPNKDFDAFIYDTIQTPDVTNTWYGKNGALLDLTFFSYNSGTTTTTAQPNSIDFKVNSNYNDKKFSTFLIDFMESIELFSKKKFMLTILESIFGIIASRSDVTTDELINQEKLNKLMDKMLDVDPCADEVVYDDSFYTFDNSDLAEIEKKANARKRGIVDLDLGCGIYEFDLGNNTSIFNLLNDINDSNNNPILQEKKVVELVNKCNSLATDKSPNNSESIKKKFNTDIILNLPKTLVNNSFSTPTIVALTNLSKYITTTIQTFQGDSFNFAIFNRCFFERVLRESFAVLVKIIFNILKREILIIVRRIVKRIIKKIAKKKIEIIKSYTSDRTGGETEGILTPLPQAVPS